MKKRIIGLMLAAVMIFGSLAYAAPERVSAAPIVKSNTELRGVWLSYLDFGYLGMTNASESKYRSASKKFIKKVKTDKYNAVFYHVRAFDDAAWKSKTFPASSYLNTGAKRSKTAAKTYKYDPLKIFIEEAREQGIEVHAWMNPYRITLSKFMDPGKSANRNRVLAAVKELLNYDIDGIHFDDYFYHSLNGYVSKVSSNKTYSINISSSKKCSNVNKLVKAVYKQTHKKKNMVFGISPQGNVSNDLNSGANVKTWLKKNGYVDYLVPQIYWTDKYGSKGNIKMFTERLKEFKALHKNSAKLYIGLALYRAGYSIPGDPGWKKSNSNLKSQVTKLRNKGCDGFIVFAARNLYNSESKKERKNLKKIL